MSFQKSILFSVIASAAAFGCHRDRDVQSPTLPPVESTSSATATAPVTPTPDNDPQNPLNTQPATSQDKDTNGQMGRNGGQLGDTSQPASAPGAGTTSSGYGTPSSPSTPTNAEDRAQGTPMNSGAASGGYAPSGSMGGGTMNDSQATGMGTDAGVPSDGGTGDGSASKTKKKPAPKTGSGSGSGSAQ